MAVGEFVPAKFLWLLDMVEVIGVARNIEDDAFDVEPDPNYQHLISHIRGNNPLAWQRGESPGVMHCETYILGPDAITHTEPWALPTKQDQPFEVKLPDGSKRPLVEGDYVRVVGRWVMDHHPEYCNLPTKMDPPEPSRCHSRGWLRIGNCHVELHPFLWNDIRLVTPPLPGEVSSVTLSLAAPLYEEQYLGGGKWFANEVAGVSGKVFIADDLSNYHESVSARIRVPAPELPPAWSDVWREMRYEEHIIKIGQGLEPNLVRSITVKPDAIEVQASLTARPHAPRPGEHASIFDPAAGYAIFQAHYDVWWRLIGARISCVSKRVRSDPAEHIQTVGGVLPDGTHWKLRLAEAVALVKRGHRFYVEQPASDRVDVVIERSRYGNEYLKTVADNEEPNNLLALPECAS